jgi:hypothetical protein
LPDEQRLLD